MKLLMWLHTAFIRWRSHRDRFNLLLLTLLPDVFNQCEKRCCVQDYGVVDGVVW